MTGFLYVADGALAAFLAISAAAFWTLIILAVCRAIKVGQRPLPDPPSWVGPATGTTWRRQPHWPTYSDGAPLPVVERSSVALDLPEDAAGWWEHSHPARPPVDGDLVVYPGGTWRYDGRTWAAWDLSSRQPYGRPKQL